MKRCRNGHDVPDDHKRCPVCEASTPIVRESACKNGHPNPGNHKWCSDCGVLFAIKDSGDLVSTEDDRIGWGTCVFDHATFLGGLSQDDRKLRGELVFGEQGIRLNQTEIMQWSDCNGLTVESYQVAKRKIAATLAFGALGGVAAKGSKDQTVITVRRNDGALAYFVIDRKNSHEVSAVISPLLRSVKVPLVGDFPPGSTPSRSNGDSLASEIERLVVLKESGYIDDDEFRLLKKKLVE